MRTLDLDEIISELEDIQLDMVCDSCGDDIVLGEAGDEGEQWLHSSTGMRECEDDSADNVAEPTSDIDIDRLKAILELENDLGGDLRLAQRDHSYFVHEDDFEEHARELADSTGAIDGDAGWPMSHIDWKGAARDLQMDYTSVDFDGTTYYYR